MSEEDISSGYSEGSNEEEMNEEYLNESSEDEIEDQESENEGMEESEDEDDEESNEEETDEKDENDETNEEEESNDEEDEDKMVTVDEIKSQIAEGKNELYLGGEFSKEAFTYLLELLKPNSETTIKRLIIGGKYHKHKTQQY